VHVLAGHFLSEKIPEFGPGMTVGVAGMGEIGRKTADFLEQSQDLKVLRFNRTVPPENSSGWLPLDQLSAALPDLSALVIATGARTPVFGSAMRPDDDGTPFPLLLDLGIPRQVDLTAPGITSGGYYSVDDLQEVAREESDVALRRQLDTYIEEQVRRFRRYCLEREWVVLLNRTQTRRFEMLGETLEAFIAERFGDSDSALQARLAAAMRELVRGYSGDVFDAVHAALEEYWRSE
jgi:glutamyl-tRNA reductase